MTIRMNEEQSSKSYSPPEMRSSQGPISSNVTDEGCPVIESGTVCGETKTLSIIKEFREIYDNCVQNMDQCNHDSKTLKKLAPFRKLVEDLWEQNAMLVETVEELEHETTCRVAMLQERLNQSNEKAELYQKDVSALIEVIRRFRDSGVLDSSGLRFNTLCDAEIYGCCKETCNERICNMKTGPCSTRRQMSVSDQMKVKEAASVAPSVAPSSVAYDQRESVEGPEKSSLSFRKSVMSQTEASQSSFKPQSTASFQPPPSTASFKPTSQASFKPTSTASFKPTSTASFKPTSQASFKPTSTASFKSPSRMEYPPKTKSSVLTYKPSQFSRMSEDTSGSTADFQQSKSKFKAESSTMTYQQAEEVPGKVEMATSYDKISVISASTSTSATASSGFMVPKEDATKSYTKMGSQVEDFSQIRPININLKLIREPTCCVMNNQCCDCECEPECGQCMCDCDY